ncbi:unnamed protein product [Scytosiphon promiscuus]
MFAHSDRNTSQLPRQRYDLPPAASRYPSLHVALTEGLLRRSSSARSRGTSVSRASARRGGMFGIDAIEVLLGTLGIASGIYDPWIGDERAGIIVTFARTASLCTLFALVFFALAFLVPLGVIEVDRTIAAVLFFSIGASAPTLARGAWSLIDMATMFNDVLLCSYRSGSGASGRGGGRACNNGTPGRRGFLAWAAFVFWTLMKHNVSWEKLNPYRCNLYRAFRNNWEGFVHGRDITVCTTLWKDAWVWGLEGCAYRAKVFFNVVVLNGLGFAFLLLQASAALGEGFLLAIGSVWLSVAIAAHADELVERANVASTRDLKLVVEELICCNQCTHSDDSGNHRRPANDNYRPLAANGTEQREADGADETNTGSYSALMPEIKRKSMGDRKVGPPNVCRCRFCTLGCTDGWKDPGDENCGGESKNDAV